jgi:hypothetical protein
LRTVADNTVYTRSRVEIGVLLVSE